MKRVLIADDAAFMRITIKSYLEKNGFEIAGEAADGSIAIQKYKELKPDIVTMDITMPNMNGLDALKEIIKYDSEAKVVMLTAMGQQNMVKEAMLTGAKYFIIKPFKEDMLVKTINSVLK